MEPTSAEAGSSTGEAERQTNVDMASIKDKSETTPSADSSDVAMETEPSADTSDAGKETEPSADSSDAGKETEPSADSSADKETEAPGDSSLAKPLEVENIAKALSREKSASPAPAEVKLGPGEFMFELGCAYCLHKLLTMKEMLVHHQSAHPGPCKIFYVLRWWDSEISYWMCPLCEHVEVQEGASTGHHHAFLDHNKEEICEPDPETSVEGVRAFVLQHWDTTLRELLRGRTSRTKLKAHESRALDEAKSSPAVKQRQEQEDISLEDDIPAWRQDLLVKTRVRRESALPARVWRSLVETGKESMACSMCSFSTGLNTEESMRRHIENHITERLYYCAHCQYHKPDIQELVNHVMFAHREEMMEICCFLNIRSAAPAPAERDVEVLSLSDDDSQDSLDSCSSSGKKPDHRVSINKSPLSKSPLLASQNAPVKKAGTVAPAKPTGPSLAPMPALKATAQKTPPGAVQLQDYMLICAYCWHKAKTCNEMAEHFGQGHKRQVRKVLYMLHHEGYEHSHWACPLCRFVRDEDKKHMVQLHVFSKHGREDMLYPGLRFSSDNIHQYLADLWTSVVQPCLNSEGHVETDSRENAIMPRNSGPLLKVSTPTSSPTVTNGGRNTNTGMPMPSTTSRKVSPISDQIVVVDDPTLDSDVAVSEEPEIVEIGRLTDEIQEVLQKAYTHTQDNKTCCNLCHYSAMGSAVVSHILEHVMLHLGDEIWLCPYCYIHKPRRVLMTAHVAHTHASEPLRIMRYIPSYSRYITMLKTLKNIYVWICSLCSRKDTRKNLMIHHLRLGHPETEFSLHKLKKGFLIKIDEDKMKHILEQQNLKPRVKLHRAETFSQHRYLQLFWEENKVRVVALLDRKRKRLEMAEDGKEAATTEGSTEAAGSTEVAGEDKMDTEETEVAEGPSPSKKPRLPWVEYDLRETPTEIVPPAPPKTGPPARIASGPPGSSSGGNVVRDQVKQGRVSSDPASHATPKVIHVLHPLFCMYCDKINTRNIVQIKRHLFTVHPTQVPIARDIVTKAKKKPQYLYVCPSEDCYFITYSWSEMYDHLGNRHADEKLGFDLSKLPRNSRLPINIRQQAVDHHQAISVPEKPVKATQDVYKCLHCPYQTKDRAYACLHVQIQHPTDLQAVVDMGGTQRLYFCPLKHCSFGTNYESLYQSHRCKDGLPPTLQPKVTPQQPKEEGNPAALQPSLAVKDEPRMAPTPNPSTPTVYYDYDLDTKPKVEPEEASLPVIHTNPPYPISPATPVGVARPVMPTPTPILIQPQPVIIAPKEDLPPPIVIKPEPMDPPTTSSAPGPVPVMIVENAHLQK